MELKILELSDLSSGLALTQNAIDPTVWYVLREKPAILAIQDHGLKFLCAVCADDEALVEDQFAACVVFLQSDLYHPGIVNGEPYFPVLN